MVFAGEDSQQSMMDLLLFFGFVFTKWAALGGMGKPLASIVTRALIKSSDPKRGCARGLLTGQQVSLLLTEGIFQVCCASDVWAVINVYDELVSYNDTVNVKDQS